MKRSTSLATEKGPEPFVFQRLNSKHEQRELSVTNRSKGQTNRIRKSAPTTTSSILSVFRPQCRERETLISLSYAYKKRPRRRKGS
jgi:hypothetical protein